MTDQTDPHRAQIEDIKASWLADPCWDLEDLDFTSDLNRHLAPYADELAAFAREHKARWAAQREAEHTAAIDAIQARILGRLAPEYQTPGPALMGLVRSLCEEIHALRSSLRTVDLHAGEAHERLDKMGG